MYIDIKILTHVLAPHYREDHVVISIDAKIASGNTQLFRIQQYLTNFSILPGQNLNMSLPCMNSAYTFLTVLCPIHGGLLVFALLVFSNELKGTPRQIGGLFLFLPLLVSLCLHDLQLTQPSPGLNSKGPLHWLWQKTGKMAASHLLGIHSPPSTGQCLKTAILFIFPRFLFFLFWHVQILGKGFWKWPHNDSWEDSWELGDWFL